MLRNVIMNSPLIISNGTNKSFYKMMKRLMFNDKPLEIKKRLLAMPMEALTMIQLVM